MRKLSHQEHMQPTQSSHRSLERKEGQWGTVPKEKVLRELRNSLFSQACSAFPVFPPAQACSASTALPPDHSYFFPLFKCLNNATEKKNFHFIQLLARVRYSHSIFKLAKQIIFYHYCKISLKFKTKFFQVRGLYWYFLLEKEKRFLIFNIN